MSRMLLSYLLPFVPVLAYGVWFYLARRKAVAAGGQPSWRQGPWSWLVAIALLVGALGVLALAVVGDGADPTAKYVPPSYQGGEVVPGRTE
jgi:hypothetical protein